MLQNHFSLFPSQRRKTAHTRTHTHTHTHSHTHSNAFTHALSHTTKSLQTFFFNLRPSEQLCDINWVHKKLMTAKCERVSWERFLNGENATAGFRFHRKIFENFPCRLVRKESWENWHFSKLSNHSVPISIYVDPKHYFLYGKALGGKYKGICDDK